VESNLIKDVEGVVERILPRDLPSDTREVSALADEAAKWAVEIDPALAPVVAGLDQARKVLSDAFNVLDEKINAVKKAAVKKAPVSAPVAADPTVPPAVPEPSVPSSPPVAEEPEPVAPPTPVSEPIPSPVSDSESAPTPSEGEAIPPTETSEEPSSSVPTTEASPSEPVSAAENDALTAFAALSPAEQAAFLAAAQAVTPPA
jgi:ribonuclease E